MLSEGLISPEHLQPPAPVFTCAVESLGLVSAAEVWYFPPLPALSELSLPELSRQLDRSTRVPLVSASSELMTLLDTVRLRGEARVTFHQLLQGSLVDHCVKAP